jgi:hypothetical protein
LWYQRQKVLTAIAARAYDEDGDLESLDALLK